MLNSFSSSILAKIGIAIIVLALIDLVYINYWVLQSSKEENFNAQTSQPSNSSDALPSPFLAPSPILTDEDGTAFQSSKAPATTSEPVVQTQIQQQTVVQTAQKEIFIPIGSGSTFNNNYTDLPGVEVSIDSSKYTGIESVVFEASLWVQDGNGKMYAQLYNKTDGRPVWNSEISTSSASGVLTTSLKIALESGMRTYKVQAKTNLTGYAAHVDNARVKITLK